MFLFNIYAVCIFEREESEREHPKSQPCIFLDGESWEGFIIIFLYLLISLTPLTLSER